MFNRSEINMNIKEIANQKIWEDFFNSNGSPSFLQSWEWGEFENRTGYEILRLGIYLSSTVNQSQNLIAIALVIKIKAKRGNFLFIPHGPVFNLTLNTKHLTTKSIIQKLLNYLIDLSKKENFTFIRIASTLLHTPE